MDRTFKNSSRYILFLDIIQPKIYDKDELFNRINSCFTKFGSGASFDDLIPESFDFHCTDICDRVQELYDIDKSKLKSIIWNFSSSINTRANIDCLKHIEIYSKPNLFIKKWNDIKGIISICQNDIKHEKLEKLTG